MSTAILVPWRLCVSTRYRRHCVATAGSTHGHETRSPATRRGGRVRAILSVACGLLAATAAAATRVVDTTSDAPVPGQLTLREAIAGAADGDVIEFAPGLFSGTAPATITLTAPLLVSKNVTLIGPGDAPGTTTPRLQLAGGGANRLLEVRSPATVLIAGLAFQGGVAAGGGALLIESGATATVQGCDFTGNQSTGAHAGGAILNRGSLTVDQCLIARNTGALGGGIASVGRLQLVRSLVASNTAASSGGGLYVSGADVIVESATFSANNGGTGGAIAFFSSNKTVNTATLAAVTVVDNLSGAQSGGLYVEGAGAVANVGGSIFARNFVVNNSGAQTPHDLGTQKSGKINSADYNIVVKPGTTLSPYGPNDQIGIDPQVGALAPNGGRTRTHAIGLGSPARDRGNPNFVAALVLTDQRGSPRVWPSGGRVDVGAFEFATTLTAAETISLEAVGARTPATVTAALAFPRGGTASVIWTIGGVAGPAYSVTVPDGVASHPISYTGEFPVGSTVVTATVVAGPFNLQSSTTVQIVDTTPPVLTLPASQTLEATSAAGATATFTATAVDLVSGAVPVTFSVPSGSTFGLGTTIVMVRATDAAGNAAIGSFTITVRDTTPPVIAPFTDVVVEATGAAGAIVTFAPTATDIVSLPAVTTSPVSGTMFPVGETVVGITATDAAGNKSSATFKVTVRDSTAPQLSLPADMVVEATGPLGAAVSFAPSATDTVSAVTIACAPASGSVFPLGATRVEVTARDTAGNVATGSFTVTIVDTRAPVIAALSNLVVEATGAAGAVVPFTGSASDIVSGTVQVTFAPASGGVFAIGTTTVTATARDAAGNSASSEFTVTVRDTTPPAIATLADLTVEAASAAGSIVSFSGSATDLVSGNVPVVFSPLAGSTFGLGVTTVTATATDSFGNSASRTFNVTVRDSTPPTLAIPGNMIVEAANASGSPVAFTATATDAVSTPTVTIAPPSGSVFPLGLTTVNVSATDAAGNIATSSFTVTVRDNTPPVIAALDDITAEATGASGAVVTFAPTASDTVSPVTITAVPASGSVFPLGETVVTVTARDAAGNVALGSFKVTVRDTQPPALSLPANVTTRAQMARGAVVTFAATATDLVSTPIVTTSPASGSVFAPGTTTVAVSARDAAGNVATGSFTVTVEDPYHVTWNNVSWPQAYDLTPQMANIDGRQLAAIRQMIARAGESRWYKFRGAPGSRIDVRLTKLPANFDVVVYSDIQQIYNQLLGLLGAGATEDQRKLALLGVEFAPEAYSPEAYSPEAYSPEAYSPEAYSPEAYSPEAYSPEAYSPEAYSPEAYSPEAYSPEAYSPEAYSPEAYSPEAYSPEAYASAQQRGVVAFSAAPGTGSEGIRFNTYSRSGDFYVRIRGQNGVYSLAAPFDLTVAIQSDLCSGVTDLNTTPATSAVVVSGAPTSLLVWDRSRIAGTDTEKVALAAALERFARAVNGMAVDVAADAQISALNRQADLNPLCPAAKNLVAEAIRNVIRIHRAAAPTIADITLVGNDHAVPFFRSNDRALLASEAGYFPPVRDGSASQTSLRYAQILSQDRYGSSSQVVLATGPYDLPEIPVGRLVETAAEVQAYLDTYASLFNGTSASGIVPTPRSAFVAGYDFLADSASAMANEYSAGLGAGATVHSLISPAELPPAFGWTADQLRAMFLGSRHDLSYLAGHFSTAGALAADYRTRFRARELADSTVDLTHALILSAGCHSGYNTVDADAIVQLTEQPDWAQAFARKRAIWVAGTGYQYGDTDFVEYTERLLQEFARALRTGSGPVPVGRALVEAKRRYLAGTAVMRGIHEKTLLQLTLYGLPMVKFNLPGARLIVPVPASDVPGVVAVTSGPGASRSLYRGELSFSPVLNRVDRTLDVVGATATVVASYFEGSDGVVSIPGEPVRPRESFNVSRPEGYVRGIGFRGGDYVDLAGFRPFTGAPATETRGVHGGFSTEVFYPVRPWTMNQLGELGGTNGVSELNAFPAQFLSNVGDSSLGTLRRYSTMQFSLFYCPVASATALANPPAINVVASTAGGSGIAFTVEVAAGGGAGVQEVWVTYTGLPGSPYHGRWQSFTLTGPADPAGIGVWTGTLPIGSASLDQIRFMVQAVNGFGATTQSTNFGRLFQPGASTLDGVGQPGAATTVSLIAPVPAEGNYRASLPLQARLVDGSGLPLAGRRLQFRVGPVAGSADTDSNGVAGSTLLLAAAPGTYTLEASFAGDGSHQNSSVQQPFAITRMPTTLTFESGGFVTEPGRIAVTLRANDGTPLKERTVVFILENASGRTAAAEITDGAGQARVSGAGIAPGQYQVTAYFGRPVVLPDGSTVSLNDPLYVGAAASQSVAVSRTLQFADEQAWTNYTDTTAPGASATNLGLSKAEILGSMLSGDSRFGPNSIMASAKSSNVAAYVSVQLSGQTIAIGTISLKVQANDNMHWRGSARLNGTSVELNVDWDVSGGSGKYHLWAYPPAGTGPLYQSVPAVLTCELILGTGSGENPAGGVSQIGGPDKPWTQQTGNSRVRSK